MLASTPLNASVELGFWLLDRASKALAQECHTVLMYI
jgi:hypothetical protein